VNAHLKTIVIWLVVIAAIVIGYQVLSAAGGQKETLDQSEFYDRILAGDVKEVVITGDSIGYEIQGKFRSPKAGSVGQPVAGFKTYAVKDESLLKMLREKGVKVEAKKPSDSSFLTLLLTWSPMLLFLGVWIFFMRQMQSG
jgi:cell division protease FtsH